MGWGCDSGVGRENVLVEWGRGMTVEWDRGCDSEVGKGRNHGVE